MIIALSIGLWGFGSNWVSYVLLSKDLNANYTRTKPYHVVLTSNDFSRLDLSAFKSRPDIENAEFRDSSIQRIEVLPDQWLPLWLFGVDHFDNMDIAKIYREQGKSAPDPGTMLMERNGRHVSNLDLNALAQIRVKSGNKTVAISGITFDPAQAPATQDAFIYGYMDKQTYRRITGEPVNERLIIRLKHVASKQEVRVKAQELIKDFRHDGIVIKSMDIPKFREHPHQFQLNTLIALQAIIGFLAFIMGAVLVSQLMQAMLAQQTRQLGVLKTVGATRYQVLGIYLTTVLVLGAIATLIVTPVAVQSGYAFAGFVSGVLNFNILTTELPWTSYAVLLAAGLLLPVLFTFPTLWRGTNISVVKALNDWGANRQLPSSLTKIINRLPIPGNLALCFRNIFRNGKRLLTTVCMITLGVAIFSTGFNVKKSLIEFLDDTKTAMKYDIQVVLKNQISPQKAVAPFQSMQNLQRIETWSGGQGRLQSIVVSASNGLGVVALPRDTDLLTWDVIEGRWLEPGKTTELVLNQVAADALNSPTVGEDLIIGIDGKTITARLVGVVKEFGPGKIYIDKDQYDALVNPAHQINSLMFTTKDRSYPSVLAMKSEIEKRLKKTNFEVLFVMSQTERAEIIFNHLNIILVLFTLLSSLVLIVGALGMASATSINVLERTREIGIMRAIGASTKSIFAIFIREEIIINGIGIVCGICLSFPLSTYAAKYFGNLILGHQISLHFAFSAQGLIITLLTMLVFGWMASRFPARKALTVSTREALCYE